MARMRRFTKEFKRNAVQRALVEETSIADIARDVGIKPGLLYQWRSEHLLQSEGEVPPGETQEQKVARLEAEVHRLRQEREILKKAVTFFAQNPE